MRADEKRLVELQDWKAQAAKYELIAVENGTLAYALKADQKNTAVPHWLCPDCYQNGKPSILQRGYNRIKHKNTFNCHPCGLEIVANSAMPS